MVTLDFKVKQQLKCYVIKIGSNIKCKLSCAVFLSAVYHFLKSSRYDIMTDFHSENVFLQFCGSITSLKL